MDDKGIKQETVAAVFTALITVDPLFPFRNSKPFSAFHGYGILKMDIRFIAKTSDCWLRVKSESGGVVSVPYGLKVDRIEAKNNRECFKILEGANAGKIASVQVGSN